MQLSEQNVKKILSELRSIYKNIEYDKIANNIRITVDNNDRPYRIGIMSGIAAKYKSMGATYSPQGSKPGAVKVKGLSIEVKGKSTKATGDAKFKPKDIEPSIVDKWLTPEEIVKNTKAHVQAQNVSDEIKKQILNVLTQTAKDTNTTIPFNVDKKLIPSEFFEVLSSVKLGLLLRSNDAKTKKILGIQKSLDLSSSKIKILIPGQANLPLLDYYISISKTSNPEEESSIKISVKSKVSSPKSNTIKFTDAFKDNEEVMKWYKSVQDPANQIGQKIIAADSVNAPARKGLLFPITAISDLLKQDKRRITPYVENVLPKGMSVGDAEKILTKISDNIRSYNKETKLSELDNTDMEKTKLSNLLNQNFKNLKAKDTNVGTLSLLCEKILMKASPDKASPEDIATKYNFYQMFYDRVLKDRNIAYAVASTSGKTLSYKFYSLINFAQEYRDWIGLRSKNSVGNLNDKLGMDV